MATVHPSVGAEFRQLLRLFESALFGLVVTGSPTLSPAARPPSRTRASRPGATRASPCSAAAPGLKRLSRRPTTRRPRSTRSSATRGRPRSSGACFDDRRSTMLTRERSARARRARRWPHHRGRRPAAVPRRRGGLLRRRAAGAGGSIVPPRRWPGGRARRGSSRRAAHHTKRRLQPCRSLGLPALYQEQATARTEDARESMILGRARRGRRARR